MRRIITSALLVAGCSNSLPPARDAGPPDLRPAQRPDLAMPDMTEPPDLAMPDLAKLPGPCMGTPAADTCVDEFFARVTMCFPVSGACTYSMGANNVFSTCWASGSKRIESVAQGQLQGNWSSGGNTCMIGSQVNTGWVYFANNKMMSVDASDRFTCPNGLSVKIPVGTCPALDAILGRGAPPQGCTMVGGPGC